MEMFEMVGPAGLVRLSGPAADSKLGTNFRVFAGTDPDTGFPRFAEEAWRFASEDEQARFDTWKKTGQAPEVKKPPAPLGPKPEPAADEALVMDATKVPKPKTEGIEKGG